MFTIRCLNAACGSFTDFTVRLCRYLQAFAQGQKVGCEFIVTAQRHGLGSVLSPHAVQFRYFGTGRCAGQDDHVYVIQYRFLADRPQNLDAVVPGKMKIQHDDTGMGFVAGFPLNMDELKRLLPVGDYFDFDIFVKA